MGCTAFRNRSEHTYSCQIKKKLNCKIVSTESIISFSAVSSSVSRENSTPLKKCLKIKILPTSPKMIFKNLSLEKTQLYRQSLEYIPYYDLLKEFYSSWCYQVFAIYSSRHWT